MVPPTPHHTQGWPHRAKRVGKSVPLDKGGHLQQGEYSM